jgi:hypothetical protein
MNNRWRLLEIQDKIKHKRENLKFIKSLNESPTNDFSPVVSLELPMIRRR